jgi:hypothetical protein
MVFLFVMPFGSICHTKTFVYKKNCPNINTARNGIDPNNNLDIQRFFHLDIPTKYQYLTGISIMIPKGRIFDTIIGVDF